MKQGSPRAPQAIFDSGVPVLGICYGQMTMAAQLGGEVEGGHHREFGRADVEVKAASRSVRFHLGHGRAASGLDEPWRPHHQNAAGLCRRRRLAERAVRGDPGRDAEILRADVPSRSGAHARRRQTDPQFRPQGRRPHRRLDHARVPRGGDREDPRPGRQGQGDLRPVRRRRFRRRRGADPRSDRRPAHLRVRRSRPAAAGRRPRPWSTCSGTTTTSRWCMWMRRSNFSASSPASPIPKRSARPSAACSSTCSTQREAQKRSAARNSWRRARSIPT